MLLEVPLEAAAASAAASPVWVAVDFDRACRVRRRGVRGRPRAGWFAAPISDFSALFACLRGCLLAIVFILWIRIALRDACTTTSPALGARRAATQEGAVDMDSNASRAGEVERKVWRDNDFLLPGKLLKMSPLVDRRSAVSTLRKWGSGARVATGIRATALLAERASQYSGDREPVFYGTAARLASCSAAVPVFPSNIHGIERFWMGALFGADLQPQFPVLGLCHFATAWQGNSSSAVEGRPAVLSR